MERLDSLSGYEFEALMADIFESLGYINVQPQSYSGDVGRDIIMEEKTDQGRRAVVVECKHKGSVGRPDIQKLYSATLTYEYDGGKRCLLVTTGTFSDPAKEEAQKLSKKQGIESVELLDGQDLIEISKDIGYDFFNKKIEIVSEQSLIVKGIEDKNYYLNKVLKEINNIEEKDLSNTEVKITLYPFISSKVIIDKRLFEQGERVIEGSANFTSWAYSSDHVKPVNSKFPDGDEILPKLISGAENNGLLPHSDSELSKINTIHLAKTYDQYELKHFQNTKDEYEKEIKKDFLKKIKENYDLTYKTKTNNNIYYKKNN